MTNPGTVRCTCWIAALLITLLIAIVYAPTLTAGFVWDDNLFIVRNHAVQSWAYAVDAFFYPRQTWADPAANVLAAWRPIRNISYLIDHSLFGLRPAGWHAHNILLHAVNAILLLVFILRLLPRPHTRSTYAVATLAVLWWALHPVQTEVVAWVKSRDDLLMLFFALASLLSALRAPASSRPLLWYILTILLLILSLLSKENAVVLALLIPAAVWVITPAPRKVLLTRRTFVYSTAAVIATCLTYWALREIALGSTAQGGYLAGSFPAMMFTMVTALMRYIQLIAWPYPPTILIADYDAFRIRTHLTDPGVIPGILILAGLTFLAFRISRNSPPARYGFLFFAAALAPFLNVIPMMQVMAERFLYFPTIGLAIGAAGCVNGLPKVSPLVLRGGMLTLTFLIIANIFVTRARLPAWNSGLSLFAVTARVNQRSWRPTNNLATYLGLEGRRRDGHWRAEHNLHLFPGDPAIMITAIIYRKASGNVEGETFLRQKLDRLNFYKSSEVNSSTSTSASGSYTTDLETSGINSVPSAP